MGVVLESGEELKADVVVVNADLVYAYSHLLPQTPRIERYAASLRGREASCSSLSFYWSLSRKIPELSTHNIFLASEYRESFDAIFKRNSLPDEPSFYVNVPSRIDPSAAPATGDSVIVLVPIGHLGKSKVDRSGPDDATSDQHWKAIVNRVRAGVLETIRARTGVLLTNLITAESINTPLEWESAFNLDKGAILGLSHGFFNVMSFRPRTRAEGLARTYFVGASTHPGTGVPIVLAGAKLTSGQILSDLRMAAPWDEKGEPSSHGSSVGVKRSALDAIQPVTFQLGTEEFKIAIILLLGLAGIIFLYRGNILVY